MRANIIPLLIILTLSACAGKLPTARVAQFKPSSYSELEGWRHDKQLKSLEAFRRSCSVIMTYKPARPISKATHIGGKAHDWQPACKEAIDNPIFSNSQARNFFEKWFKPYKVTDAKGSNIGKFTGYYELELNGSRTKSKKYKYPVYKAPPNLHTTLGHHSLSHSAINNGSLANKKLEIAWVEDKARLFFMQIQGSGVIKLAEGGEMKVGFSGQNGYGYTSIGPLFKKYTKEHIALALDMMRWLHKNPKKGRQLMEENQSYTFFKEIYGESPIGGQGVPLSAERSMAIDYKLHPYSTPIWLQTQTPNTTNYDSYKFNRLMIAQDTGGDIKGAIRGDIFYGRGKVAEEMASFTNKKGSFFMLFPKTASIPAKYSSR